MNDSAITDCAFKYLKYPSLVNHYAIGKERRITEKLDKLWYSTEKIHGANAAYYLDKDGNEAFAKRSGIIDFETSSDKQFNMLPSCVNESIRESAKKVLGVGQGEYIIVYGEYFGAGVQVMNYDIIKERRKAFRVFDVFIKTEHMKEDQYYVLGKNNLKEMFSSKDLVPFKDVDTLYKLLDREISENSELGGYSEGEVYKPVSGYFIDSHNRFIGVKHKTTKYLETEKISTKQPKSKPNFGVQELKIQEDLGRYITLNRVRNVLSHGKYELIPKNIGKIMMEVKRDAIDEFKRETTLSIPEGTMFEVLINGFSKQIADYIKELIHEQTIELVL